VGQTRRWVRGGTSAASTMGNKCYRQKKKQGKNFKEMHRKVKMQKGQKKERSRRSKKNTGGESDVKGEHGGKMEKPLKKSPQ